MCRLSIFGIVAALVYVIGAITNASEIAEPYQEGLLALTDKGDLHIVQPWLFVIVMVMNVALALRLYLHAWAVDENKRFRRAIRSVPKWRRGLEWFLRLLWVMAIAWLPTTYGALSGKPLGEVVNVHLYLFLIVVLVLIWDCTMRNVVFGYTTQSREDLVNNWLKLDVGLASSLGVVWLLESFIPGSLGNWRVSFVPTCFVIACVISLLQLGLWSWRICCDVEVSPARSISS